MKTIVIIVDYFGQWPRWFDMFLKSCERNPTVDWRIHTDCPIPKRPPANVSFRAMSQGEYNRRVSEALGISFRPHDMYNICNVRPAFGVVHAQEIRGYDYFGWGDLDVVYGDLRRIYTPAVLTHNVVSSNVAFCSGHLTLLRNVRWLRQAFRHIPGWRERLEDPGRHPWRESLDEAKLSGILSPRQPVRDEYGPGRDALASLSKYWERNYFREQWSTPFTPFRWRDGSFVHPEVWYWQNGRLTNDRDGNREFAYLHLMNFKAKTYINEERYGSSPTWEGLPRLIHFDCRDIGDRTVRIDRQGFHLLPPAGRAEGSPRPVGVDASGCP